MSDVPYMPLWVGDFLAKTTELDARESGAYLLLLMGMWTHGGSLPNDPKKLKRVARVGRDWPKVWEALERYFIVVDGRLSNRRLLEELAHVRAVSEARAQAGSKGGYAKARGSSTQQDGLKRSHGNAKLHLNVRPRERLRSDNSLKNIDQGLANGSVLLQQNPSNPYPYPDSGGKPPPIRAREKSGADLPDEDPFADPDDAGGAGGAGGAQPTEKKPAIHRVEDETRVRLLDAMGLDPSGISGPSSFSGTVEDMIEAQSWSQMGLPLDVQLRVIREVSAAARARDPGWRPYRWRYFTPAMRRIKLASASAPDGASQSAALDRMLAEIQRTY